MESFKAYFREERYQLFALVFTLLIKGSTKTFN